MRRVALIGLIAAALLAAAPSGEPGALGAGADLTCPLALTRLEPTTTNALLLDTHAVYWAVGYSGVPGTRLRITGEFPHARYIAYNAYDAQARPADAASDVAIAPNAGSVNPFLPGAPRDTSKRSYTMFVDFAPKPAHPAPNTLYTGTATSGSLWYRVYMPDAGRDETGGVGLPQVTLEPAAGGGAVAPSVCRHVQAPTANAVQSAFADSNGAPPLPLPGDGYPGRNPPSWKLFVNLSMSAEDILLDNSRGDSMPAKPPPPTSGPGFFANRDNAYVYAPTSQGFGDVLVIHAKAPTYAATRPAAPVMPAGSQVRYWSFCQYDPLSQRVIGCVADDEVPLDSRGYYTVVVSTPAERPANARPACGVAWIPWGPTPQGLLIYRQVLAALSFAQAIDRIGTPGRERETLGPYYPSASYLADKSAFGRRGCRR